MHFKMKCARINCADFCFGFELQTTPWLLQWKMIFTCEEMIVNYCFIINSSYHRMFRMLIIWSVSNSCVTINTFAKVILLWFVRFAKHSWIIILVKFHRKMFHRFAIRTSIEPQNSSKTVNCSEYHDFEGSVLGTHKYTEIVKNLQKSWFWKKRHTIDPLKIRC